MSATVDAGQELIGAVREIALEVAAAHADDVDRRARFPAETIAALRAQRALSAFVPVALGGGGVAIDALASCCLELGRRCAASAMVFAMHQAQVVTLVRHAEPGSWFERYLQQLAEEQRLIASVTSEIGTGGDMGRSIAALTSDTDRWVRFEKQAPTVSYGEYADDLATTLRRSPEAEPGDQVLVISSREQTSLEAAGSWDVLGMRGTCSPGFVVRARVPVEQVLQTPFARVASESMVPVSHLLWSHVWLGIAEDAFERARAFVRAAARRSPGATPAVAHRLAAVLGALTLLRAEVRGALSEFIASADGPGRERLATMAGTLRFNNLKVAASEQAVAVCRGAIEVCGIMGYRNDTPYSVGRHLRDVMSAPLMVANDRINETDAGLLLIAKEV